MSLPGTNLPCIDVRSTTASGGKADIAADMAVEPLFTDTVEKRFERGLRATLIQDHH
jgi:hypothetical protein